MPLRQFNRLYVITINEIHDILQTATYWKIGKEIVENSR